MSRAEKRRNARGDIQEGDARQGGPSHAQSETERQAAEMARIVARRAIRRLDVLEWVIFLGGAVLATVAGGLVAWLMVGIAGWDFRATWMGASVLLFVVPGLAAIIKIKRDERSDALRAEARREGREG
ncbi:MAG: hypothetical protein HKN72_02680 [Gemmatimonadetes bacterium]|nr:hypothetical protein [Gemmatimonadota bacterium]NNF12099.1 hypothetical protein [Gemmatimonadota bacterium]